MASGEQANQRHLISRTAKQSLNRASVCEATIEEHDMSCIATCQVAALHKSIVDFMVNRTATIVAIPVSYANVPNKRFAAIPCKNDRLSQGEERSCTIFPGTQPCMLGRAKKKHVKQNFHHF